MLTVTKNDLVNAVAAHGLSKRQSASVVGPGFAITFRGRASRRGRNPQTGASIEITARKVLTFKPSKGLKQRINVR